MESAWAGWWVNQLKISPVYHRKVWEYCYLLQGLFDHNRIRDGSRGLAFGSGREPIASYLASRGCNITVTDLEPSEAAQRGWVGTNQHTSTIAQAFHSHLVDEETFKARVGLAYVDMNDIPASLVDYDFCWSLCSLEHLGSIKKGLDFIENSLKTLKSGGVAIHTTEFNFLDDEKTIDNWPTVLFQRRHFTELRDRLVAAGHRVQPLDFDVGRAPMDGFIDLPPYVHDLPNTPSFWRCNSQHLKLMLDGFASTCFGMIIVKA
jgi:hypothetical protein